MNHGKARTEGKDRYCHKHGGFAPTDGFRSLPGQKRREICAECYAKAMQPVKIGDMDAERLPF